jgi:hypothetical protein
LGEVQWRDRHKNDDLTPSQVFMIFQSRKTHAFMVDFRPRTTFFFSISAPEEADPEPPEFIFKRRLVFVRAPTGSLVCALRFSKWSHLSAS